MSNSVVIVIHTYKGNGGHYLSYEYLKQLLALSKKQIIFRVYAFFYGFSIDENYELKKMFESLNDEKRLTLNYEFKQEVGSEVPTLKFAVDMSKNLDPECLVLYFHSKGASYEDQDYHRNWGLISIAGLAAVIDVLHGKNEFMGLYNAFGSFAGVGVLERYGHMTPHFSGNFWITTAKFLAAKEIDNKWYAFSYHNKHFAEALLGHKTSPELLFNLMTDYQAKASSRPDLNEVYGKISRELSEIQRASILDLIEVNNIIREYYNILQDQHILYCSGRYFWSLRKFILGNKSYLRYYKVISRILDKIFPYTNSQLFMHFNGPKHFDIFQIRISKKDR